MYLIFPVFFVDKAKYLEYLTYGQFRSLLIGHFVGIL
jgi:hypothetical protein